MGLYSGGLIIGRICASEIWGAYFREGLFLGGLIIRILQYIIWPDFVMLFYRLENIWKKLLARVRLVKS